MSVVVAIVVAFDSDSDYDYDSVITLHFPSNVLEKIQGLTDELLVHWARKCVKECFSFLARPWERSGLESEVASSR